jgi:hypothetical protein
LRCRYKKGTAGREFAPPVAFRCPLPATASPVEACSLAVAPDDLFRAVRPTDSELAIRRFFVNCDLVEPLPDKVLGARDLLGPVPGKGSPWAARLASPDDFVGVGIG